MPATGCAWTRARASTSRARKGTMRRSEQRRAAVFALYQSDVTGRPPAELVEREARPFTHELVDGVQERREELDELIGRYSEGWSLERIAPLERNILRVALY